MPRFYPEPSSPGLVNHIREPHPRAWRRDLKRPEIGQRCRLYHPSVPIGRFNLCDYLIFIVSFNLTPFWCWDRKQWQY
jgi:hypothetical protein